MKSLGQFMLVLIAACTLLFDSGSLRAAPERSPSPPGSRREALAVLRQWGVLTGKTRVLYVERLNAQSWLVGLQFPDGRKENYSVDTVAKDCGYICRH
jgi:hypothetical protein